MRARPTLPVALALAVAASMLALASPARAADQDWAARTLASMTLEEKVGQLFVPRIHGATADTADPTAVALNRAELGVDNALGLVDRYHVGGLVYFAENVTTPRGLAEFGNRVQVQAARQRVPVPVLTSIDQEQGLVARIGSPATQFPGNMALGASRSAADAWSAARITGIELRAMGVFQDYAPVADVNVNPANPVIGVRSFSSSPALVARLTRAQVDGYQAAGVAATAKHFPGHGDTGTDSHTALPVITHDGARLRAVDLAPFRAAIDAGVDSIMTAHIVVPAVDASGLPATLSSAALTGLLRDELGFDGVIVTDSLRMQGVRTMFTDAEVAVRALQAGADQLLDPPDLPAAYAAVLDAVRDGALTLERIDASVERVLRLKAQRGLTSAADVLVDPALVDAIVGNPAHQFVAQQVTDRTTTLVRDTGTVLPQRRWVGKKVLVTGRGVVATRSLATSLMQRGAVVTVVETGSSPSAAAIEAASSAAHGADLVVGLTYNVADGSPQATLVRALLATGRPLVVAATGTPYDIAAFPRVPAYLAAYSGRPVAMESLARVLTGQVAPTGRLPVAVPAAGDPGADLYAFSWRVVESRRASTGARS